MKDFNTDKETDLQTNCPLNYEKALKDLIKIEKENKEKISFQEPFINQLERRLKIYKKSRQDALKEVVDKFRYCMNLLDNETIYETEDLYKDMQEYITEKEKELKQGDKE